MSPAPDSFRQWLTDTIRNLLSGKSGEPSYIVWCDPKQEWKELLELVAADLRAELWADDVHELALRDRFMQEERRPRIIWLPRSRHEITFFKVFEIRAQKVWELTLDEALMEYGVTQAKLQELGESVAAFTRAQFGKPKETWTNVTDRDTCDDQCILEVLAGTGTTIEDLRESDRFSIFRRRILQEFGLPDPENGDAKNWQLDAIASLLCSDAALKSPDKPTKDAARVIRSDRQREKALALLDTLMKHRDYTPAFEQLAPDAEARTSLRFWAQECDLSSNIYTSLVVEQELWRRELKTIQSCGSDGELVRHLADHIGLYKIHAKGFWGSAAKNPVRWDNLILMADIAKNLHDQSRCSAGWKEPADAIAWFTGAGWKVDHAGEMLFKDDETFGPELLKVRTRLRSGYLRHLDTINQAFSELLAQQDNPDSIGLFAGEIVDAILKSDASKNPVAILYLDALRFDLGSRIADQLNAGEPSQRASVRPARSPLPSVTPLGMAFALPGICGTLKTGIEGDRFTAISSEYRGDLADISKRRDYLANYFAIKEKKARAFMKIKNLVTAHPDEITVKKLGKHLIVFGDELDTEGHDDQLRITGADEYLDRYVRTIRLLRDGGYSTIIIATDHGFFHWDPADDEIIQKPEGKILWRSRRAVVGEPLTHPTALSLQVSGSDLQCMVPRSVNAFETYGGIGYFHGGATLQELIIPVIIVSYPKKVKRISAVIKPVEQIISLQQRIDVAPSSIQKSLDGTVDDSLVGRTVTVKVMNPENGELIFKAKQPVTVVPGGDVQPLILVKVNGTAARRDAVLSLKLIDNETEELLEQKPVTLKVDLDDWD